MDNSHFKYTLKHKDAFLRVEKELLRRNTVSAGKNRIIADSLACP